jgi:hypothetical protein
MKTKRYLIPLGLTFFIALGTHVQAQQPLDKTLGNLAKQSADYPFEKVYLHMDKPYYGAGDTIWLKAYAVAGASHVPSMISGLLNVQLINQKGMVIRALKLRLEAGLANGDLPLGDTVSAGNYRLRAYTNWMRNAGEAFYFDKTFPVVNAVSSKVFTRTDFTFSSAGAQPTVDAVIKYFGLDEKPFAGKPVTYEVNIGSHTVSKGNGTTDGMGNLHLSFPGSVTNGVTANISTNILLANKKIEHKDILVKALSPKVDVQFFPEGGHLVNGLVSKVAFKAVGPDGLGADVKGSVIDDQGNEVITFASTHLGMGTFFLSPQNGRTYKASITNADGSKWMAELPEAVDNGYVMAIHSDSANVVVKISKKGYEGDTGGVSLVAQNQGEIFLQAKGAPGKTSFIAVIPKNKFPTGIVQFTLFSATGEPMIDRQVFVRNNDQLALAANTTQPGYQPRKQVTIRLNAKKPSGQPVKGDFSVAVTDESKVKTNEANENTILANILLTSNLKGYIEEPNYYFANITKTTDADLDALLLTQGYHSYSWKDVMGNTLPVISYQPERAITVSGKMTDKQGMALTRSKITLLADGTPPQVTDTLTDGKGKFAFYLDFMDGEKFTLKAPSAYHGVARFEMDKPALSGTLNKNLPDQETNFESRVNNYLQAEKSKYDAEVKYNIGNHSALLKEVKVSTSRPKTERELKVERAVEFSSNLNGKGAADQVIVTEDIEGRGCPTWSDCLAGKIIGAVFVNGWPMLNRPITFSGGNKVSNGRQIMTIVVDNSILSINPSMPAESQLPQIDDVASIEVLRSGGFTAIYGTRGGPGVLIITTKHGNGFLNDFTTDGGHISPLGFFKPDAFYSPKYEVSKPEGPPDLRSTVYWNPSVKTDKDGNATISFFNADAKATYRVVIEGIDKNGSIGRKVFEYKVE